MLIMGLLSSGQPPDSMQSSDPSYTSYRAALNCALTIHSPGSGENTSKLCLALLCPHVPLCQIGDKQMIGVPWSSLFTSDESQTEITTSENCSRFMLRLGSFMAYFEHNEPMIQALSMYRNMNKSSFHNYFIPGTYFCPKQTVEGSACARRAWSTKDDRIMPLAW